MKRRLAGRAPLIVLLLGLGLALLARAWDAPHNGPVQNFWDFYGLNPTNTAGDPDQDGMTNGLEAVLGTDPWAADSDLDGFGDAMDSNPVSRVVLHWGVPEFTRTNECVMYLWPNWWLDGFKAGGECTNDAWHVPADSTRRASTSNWTARS